MTDEECVRKAVVALRWGRVEIHENARGWEVRAEDPEGVRHIAQGRSTALAWRYAREQLEVRMRKQIGEALQLKDFLDRAEAGW